MIINNTHSLKCLQFDYYVCTSTNIDMYSNYLCVGCKMTNAMGIAQNEVNINVMIHSDCNKYEECYCYSCWNDIAFIEQLVVYLESLL